MLSILACQDHHKYGSDEVIENINAKERGEWRSLQKGGDHNAQIIKKARSQTQSLFKKQMSADKSLKDAGINGWEDLGPRNVGGRIKTIAIDPNNANRIFIGGVAGGIWRSTDGGTNWTEMTPPEMSYPITWIEFNPNNTNEMVATTGELAAGFERAPGVGVIKSVDGGNSWYVTNPPPAVNFFWLNRIKYHPTVNNRIFAIGSSFDQAVTGGAGTGTIYRSNDNGENWAVASITNGVIFDDLEIDPADGLIYIGGNSTLLKSTTTSGTNFNTLTANFPNPAGLNGARHEVTLCGANVFVLKYLLDNPGPTTFRSELWQSPDQGATWNLLTNTQGTRAQNILGDQGNYDNALWVDPTNCNTLLLGGIDLWRYTINTNTLTRISDWRDDIGGNNSTGDDDSIHADQHVIVSEPNFNGTTRRDVFIGNDGGIYKTTNPYTQSQNGWSTSASLNDNIFITQFVGGDISPGGDTIVGGSQDNSSFVNRNANTGSKFWKVYHTGDGGYCAIDPRDPEYIYTTAQFGSLWRSDNGGDSYCNIADFGGITSPFSGDCAIFDDFFSANDNPGFYAPFKMDKRNPDVIYMGATRLWRNDDMGDEDEWTAIKPAIASNSQIFSFDISVSSPSTIYVGHVDGTLMRTANTGGIWSADINTTGFNGNITDIAIHPQNSGQVIFTMAGYNQTNIWYRGSTGQAWQNRSLPFDMQVNTVTWHPENDDWVYVGTDSGIFASEDRGQSWSVLPFFSTNEGPTFTEVMELFWQGNSSPNNAYYLVAATHGRGMWRTSFPLLSDLYVDKGNNGFEQGTMSRPWNTFREAVNAAGHGSTIKFLSTGDHDEAPSSIIIKKKVEIKLENGNVPVVIK